MITVEIEDKDKIVGIIQKSDICFVGMIDLNGLPYVIPMNFGYEEDVIYMHSAQEGFSIESLGENPNVCIVFCPDNELRYMHEQVACSYRMKSDSVICRGKVVFVDDFDEKVNALNILMKHYSKKEFKYSDPAVINVKVWKVEIESVSCKSFGAPNPNSQRRI